MSPNDRRKSLLLVGAGLLTLLVVVDRFAGGSGDEPDSEEMSVSEAYLARAGAADRQRRLAEQEDEWRAALAESQSAWDDARKRMIHAPSAEVASSRLRDMVETAMRDLGLRLAASNPVQARATVDGEPVRIIGLTLNFEAPNPDAVYRLIDRLENLPDAATNIASLNLAGPGPLPTGGGVTVTAELQALAFIGQES